jgi:hypothetical protein
MKLPYSEGSVFVVPLRKGGCARGVIARASRRGRVILGYFFGPRFASAAGVKLDDLRFWEHPVRNEKEFEALCDYIHYNPVKHEKERNGGCRNIHPT